MTYRELYERIDSLARSAEASKDDNAQLMALVLHTLSGAIVGGMLRSFAQHTARWADDALKGIDAERN